MTLSDTESDHIESGEAVDGESIIRLRPEIEAWVKENVGEFTRSELYWNLKDTEDKESPFIFEIHFFKDAEQKN